MGELSQQPANSRVVSPSRRDPGPATNEKYRHYHDAEPSEDDADPKLAKIAD
jgi:hypothetical protein